MGNLLEKQNENENKEEQKESLDNDEIPPDTQIDNAQQENIQNEVSPENENENQTVQQNQPIQEIQGGEEVETQQYQINQDGQQDQVYQYIKDGKIYQVGQDGQLYQVIQEIQDVQEDEDDQMAQLGQQYQINQLEQFYQINQGQNQQIIPPQAYQIINQDQEEQGYQIFQQNHPHQFNLQNQLNIQNQENKLFQQNYQNIKTRNAEYQITRVDNSTFESKKGYNNLEDKISGRGLQFKAKQQRLNKKFKKNIITKTTKRTEPKDSNPKVLLISNIKGEADILNMNMMNYNRNSFKNSIKNNIKNNNKKNNDELTMFRKGVICEPFVTQIEIDQSINNQFLFLASDGIWDVISEEDMQQLIKVNNDTQYLSSIIVEKALFKKAWDNLSIFVVKLT